MNAEILMSNEFVSFSSKIKTLKEERDVLKEEFQQQYAEYKEKLASIDKSAEQAEEEFNQWMEKQNEDPANAS